MAEQRKTSKPHEAVLKAMYGDNAEFGERFDYVIERCGGLVRAANVAGASTDTLVNWREGRTKPNFFGLIPLCRAADVSLDWLGGGLPRSSSEASLERSMDFAHKVMSSEFSLVPYFPEVEASAGFGSLVEEGYSGAIAFRTSWLHKMGVHPEFARALSVRGDSMEPTIRHGDILLIDTSVDRVQNNGIYVVVFGGLLLVKRISVKRDGGFLLVSDRGQDLYPTEEIPPSEASQFNVAGRVAWLGRAM